jgi:fatty-acyl-CoA synthase
MHPYQHALKTPERLAFIVADTGEKLTYRQLDDLTNQGAHLFRQLGLKPGDRIGLLLKNCAAFPIVYWAGQRAGLIVTMISTHLKAAEARYILADCQARLLITSADVGETAEALARDRAQLAADLEHVISTGPEPLAGAMSWDEATSSLPVTPIADQVSGYSMIYSSGTTGRPKGIVLSHESGPIEQESRIEEASRLSLGNLEPLVTFNAAPLYHGAALVSMITTLRAGGTAVFLRKFDAAAALRAIEQWRVTFAQFVPTMFVRMLALPDAERESFDLSSLRRVHHAAAPCPISVKRRMLDWFGPIIHEYYSGTEANGLCFISSEEWLRKPGSVGRALQGTIHICDEDGKELPTGAEGLIYFENDRPFEYLNDPERTAAAIHRQHSSWSTIGDIGRVDEDGYLFLTDRRDFTIISGGVNIYPRATEDALIQHPSVADVAVIGVPDPEFGESVKAIVEPKDWSEASPELARALIDHCRTLISPLNCPRSVDFVRALPRLATGKLAKHELRKSYRPDPVLPDGRERDRVASEAAAPGACSGSESAKGMPTGEDPGKMGPRRTLTRHIEAGALLKFARATGETDPMFTDAGGEPAAHLVAPPTYVATFCEVLAGVFTQTPEHNMFLHSADAVVNFEPIRPGDTITATAELSDIARKIGSRGPTTIQRGMVTLTNQHGRTVSTVEVEMRSFTTIATGNGHD